MSRCIRFPPLTGVETPRGALNTMRGVRSNTALIPLGFSQEGFFDSGL